MKLSLLTIILGHGTALISVATTEVFAGLQKLDRAQEEASLDLGANYLQTFWHMTLPNLRLSIIGAALLIFTLSMDEIAVSFFLIGRDNTLPLEIWGRCIAASLRKSTPSPASFSFFRWRHRDLVPPEARHRRQTRGGAVARTSVILSGVVRSPASESMQSKDPHLPVLFGTRAHPETQKIQQSWRG